MARKLAPLRAKELPPWAPKRADVLVNIVDDIAKSNPSAQFAYYPILPTSYAAGYQVITYGVFANIVNGLAWWLVNEFGPGKGFETIAYVGTNDIRYNAFVLAAIKAGYKMFFTSPRNSLPAQESLLRATKSKALVTPNLNLPVATAIAGIGNLKLVQAPSLDELYSQWHPEFPYDKTFEQARDEPFVVLHTSGTTGMPKPLVWTHAMVASIWETVHLQAPEGYAIVERFQVGKKIFATLPPFHAGGMAWTLIIPVFAQSVAVIPIQGTIPTVQLVVDGLNATTADCAVLAPPMVEELNKKPELLEFLVENLEFVFYAGGDISQKHGDFVSSRIPLFPTLGGTDLGIPAQLQPTSAFEPSDWKYFNFHSAGGLSFRHVDEDVYEVIMSRDACKLEFKWPFLLFPESSEYSSGDLFSPHPTKPNLWRYRGRGDDIIVFLTGEKTNPVSMEQHVARHPEVKAALVAGAQRFQAALILELANKEKEFNAPERAAIIERIWPLVEEANEDCPAHAKISKSLILIALAKKPFSYSGKGTVQRRTTLKLFENEINALYHDFERLATQGDEVDSETNQASTPKEPSSVKTLVRQAVLKLTSWGNVEDTDNIFLQGMDSLQALLLTRRLRLALKLPAIAPSTVYSNPSISALVDALISMLTAEQQSLTDNSDHREKEVLKVIELHRASVDKVASLPIMNGIPKLENDTSKVFILTGSTGSIGSYLLATLLSNPSVSHIYCLNRSNDSKALQQTRNKQRQLTYNLDSARVTFAQADLGKETFGLEKQLYQELQARTTHIIHNAWPVDFNLSLDSFQPSLNGIDRLIEFVQSTPRHPHLLFVSSIGTTTNAPETLIPEDIVLSLSTTDASGYAESKYIAESILGYASTKLNIPISIARVGQVAGPISSSGAWNESEWFPSLVRSSATIGALPDSLGALPIDWVPVDVLAEVLQELALAPHGEAASGNSGASVFQPVNSHVVAWASLLPAVAKALEAKSGKPPQVVSLRDWIERVRVEAEKTRSDGSDGGKKADAEAADVALMLMRNPAAKLLEWFTGLLEMSGEGKTKKWENKKAVQASKTLAELGPVSDEWVGQWVERCFN